MIRKELFETIDGNVAKTGLEKYQKYSQQLGENGIKFYWKIENLEPLKY